MEHLKLSTASRGQNQTSLASSVSFSFPAAAQPLLTPKQPISAPCVTKRQLEMLHRNTSTCHTCHTHPHPPTPQCCSPGFHCSALMRLRRWETDVPICSYISPSSLFCGKESTDPELAWQSWAPRVLLEAQGGGGGRAWWRGQAPWEHAPQAQGGPGIPLTSLLSQSGCVGRRVCLCACQGDRNQHGWRHLSPSVPIAPVMIWRVFKTQERSVKNHWFSRECTGLGLTRHPSVRSSTLWKLSQFSAHLGSLISSKEKQCPVCKRLSEQRHPTCLRMHIG